MGVVANITLPPIVFTPYFTSGTRAITLAWIRGLTISIGIIAALVLNSTVYPRLCRVMFLDSACRTVGLLAQLYTNLSRDLFQHGVNSSWSDKRRRLKLEWHVRNDLHRMSILVATMNDELSLVPKPMRRYRQIIAALQRFLDLLTGLRKIREHIPRKTTVISAVEERREFVSCVCVSLFACEQVFGARHPLPQFLPSARQALGHLQRHVEEQIRRAREELKSGTSGLSVVYALAETNVLADIVDAIKELLLLCRQLFGTTAWFDYKRVGLTAMISVHEEVGSQL
ncbi:hypothetical protein WG66_007253 [Moniliophthora roreri]|nr:hypothetical protein WG66_007253 [Moniliophthora roreri]